MLTEILVESIVNFIAGAGYAGLVVLMAMESTIFPVPSEAVLPFAGFLIAHEKFSFIGVVFFSTLGSLIGSLISYYIGAFGGRHFIKRFGKYVFLNNHHLNLTETFFKKHGEITVFVGRFIPVVRHFISIPAGIGKMNLLKFSVFTIIGAGIWNTFLVYIGFSLKNNWSEIIKYSQIIDIIIILGFVVVIAYFLYSHTKH